MEKLCRFANSGLNPEATIPGGSFLLGLTESVAPLDQRLVDMITVWRKLGVLNSTGRMLLRPILGKSPRLSLPILPQGNHSP